jgi:Domain of unknown function (DU1801)
MTTMLDKLKGGDRRSIGRADEVVSDIQKNQSLFKEVFKGLENHDPIVRMRSADVVEKITRKNPELLTGFENKIIKELSQIEQQEVCWHVALLLPRLSYTKKQEGEILDILKDYLSHKSKIVNVNSMEALAIMAIKNQRLKRDVKDTIQSQVASGSPAVQARGRKLLKRLSNEFADPKVEEAFNVFPPAIRKKLMRLRALIFDEASKTDGVGELEETLKWGQPSYLTTQSKSGSTIRLGREKKTKGDYAIYFKCQTTLVATIKDRFQDKFRYEGNRAILFNVDDKIPVRELRHCIALALTYHRNKKKGKKPNPDPPKVESQTGQFTEPRRARRTRRKSLKKSSWPSSLRGELKF